MRTADIWFPAETRVAQDGCARYNPQNERLYYPKDTKKDAAIESLYKPQKQRAPGVMAHLTVSAANGGAMLKRHFAPHGQTMTGAYDAGMFEADAFRQIDAAAPDGVEWVFQHDLASAHTSKAAKALLSKENARAAPRMPSSAALNPSDVFVNPALEKRLQGQDLDTIAKLKKQTAAAVRDMSKCPTFRKQLKKACLSFRARVRFVAENGGRKVVRSLLKKSLKERKAAKKSKKQEA